MPVISTLSQDIILEESIFKCGEFYCSFGEDHLFDKAVMRMLVNIYADEMSSLRSLKTRKA